MFTYLECNQNFLEIFKFAPPFPPQNRSSRSPVAPHSLPRSSSLSLSLSLKSLPFSLWNSSDITLLSLSISRDVSLPSWIRNWITYRWRWRCRSASAAARTTAREGPSVHRRRRLRSSSQSTSCSISPTRTRWRAGMDFSTMWRPPPGTPRLSRPSKAATPPSPAAKTSSPVASASGAYVAPVSPASCAFR